jgi:hypothetical protein
VLTCTEKGVVANQSLFKMNVYLVKAKFQAVFEPSVLLARFILCEFRILECIFQILLNHLEKREDFADSGNLQLRVF